MKIDGTKLQQLIHTPFRQPTADDLRREGNVFFVGGSLPPRETLETIYDSWSQAPAHLIYVTFGGIDAFHEGEELVRLLKKNFHVHVMGRFDIPVPAYLLERAYAAGVDVVDIPLQVFDSGLSQERGLKKGERLKTLADAITIFPKWGVVSTLIAGDEACCATVSGIDQLLKAEVVPLVEVSRRAAQYSRDEIGSVFLHLAEALHRKKVETKPLLPLLTLTTPLVLVDKGGILKGFINRLHGRRLLAASELRRALRVHQVEESFESAGL